MEQAVGARGRECQGSTKEFQKVLQAPTRWNLPLTKNIIVEILPPSPELFFDVLRGHSVEVAVQAAKLKNWPLFHGNVNTWSFHYPKNIVWPTSTVEQAVGARGRECPGSKEECRSASQKERACEGRKIHGRTAL